MELTQAAVAQFLLPDGPKADPDAPPEMDYEQLAFLREPNHALWQLARACRVGGLRAGVSAGEVLEWANEALIGAARPELRNAADDLLKANLLLVAACATDGSQRGKYIDDAGAHYANVLREMGESDEFDKQGKSIARRTFERLGVGYPSSEYNTRPARTYVLSAAGNEGSYHLLMAECDDSPSVSPGAYFDPVRIGVVDFGERNNRKENFLAASVLPAWKAYRDEATADKPRAIWWGWLEVADPNCATLTGPSAGAAFWAAFRAAHENLALDLTVAVSGAIIQQDSGKWGLSPVGSTVPKCDYARNAGVTTVLLPVKSATGS